VARSWPKELMKCVVEKRGALDASSAISSASVSLDRLLNEPAWRDAPLLKLVQQGRSPDSRHAMKRNAASSLPHARRLNELLPGWRWLTVRTGAIAIGSVDDFETLQAA
jgi:hypothetical protein